MINADVYQKDAELLKALAHPHRLCIIKGLLEGGCNVTKIQACMKLPQSTVSQHLAKLRSAGIITGKKNAQETCYSVCDERVAAIIKILYE